MRSNVTLSEGQRNLGLLINEIDEKTVDWNEANTRIHLIDRLLTQCLGWPKEPGQFVIEQHADGEYMDYILGSPPVVIWEAKRFGVYFDFPADADNKAVGNISDILLVNKSVADAMRQVQGYCNNTGV